MASAIELRKIDKSFGPVHANRAIDLAVERGTIHGIVGENGAGKSTLMSILYGFYEADSGEIFVGGEKKAIRSSQDAIAAGIGMVHQHFMLVDPFTVLENVMLGAEGGALLARGQAKARAELTRLEAAYHLDVDPDAVVGELAVGSQQRVEILKALYRGADILILDEPTGVLTPAEADQLFEILKVLKAQGKTVLLITHKLREIMAVTDRVSVMRRGEMVATLETARTNPAELAELMVGRRVLLRVDKKPAQPGRTVLSVETLTLRDEKGVARVENVSFTVRAGEIVGIAGVAGNGQSEVLEAIAGIRQPSEGRILIDGRDMAAADPGALRKAGLAHVPEDRLRMGLVKAFAAYESAILGYHDDPALGRGPFLDQGRMIADLAAKMHKYDVRPQDPRLKTANFSGGNAQKIVLAREIERDPELLIVGQPTRGVDIGAIEFIHRQLLAMRDAGKAILLVSVELEEVMALSDRILVMCAGRISGECPAERADEQRLGLLMAGVMEQAA
ncbi:ABC transporter ATP-binding protein [Labrys wisconsinensis]|uniref:Simple sugar transport system ATP-binding protein n=1 Tax=Labrys wisconsinensis TaxID=425677 RepID=A0ABU0JDP6_9HYPH|nr:ABC transporter ATP-binding protein [Labrys wisconsinensis]MDQ0472404.1 simple sugar transport system ATP-binding protein [Labrys wisconsinensis]